MAVKLFRCKICGDPHIGEEAPDRCPHCGAKGKLVVPIEQALELKWDYDYSEKDLEFIKQGLELEKGAVALYECAQKKSQNVAEERWFNALKKAEQEHISVFKKMLKLDKVDPVTETCADEYKANVEETKSRETNAIAIYNKAAQEADHERVREIFAAISQVEQDHLDMANERLGGEE